ncbi:MAG: cysteine-rich CWC family protein [Burkholderiales bacterium]|nr:cysteine-rich CWC family protein [Burkholderiales bacterium]MDE1929895.1 cysteine-rich CWC family protein [Burkholderiales bacterium]MDE2160991.1 cysteine-rich CWC family protein [Burkholderiales bacterium]MDE2505373.1 cysteine-rich CWC family protein [Burkholderiales bacterium]
MQPARRRPALNPDPAPLPARSCPLCGGPNACRPAQEGHFDQDCWCRAVRFAPALLERLAPEARGRSCICRACAQARGD